MGELIAALVEAVVGVFMAFVEALPAILELLLFILEASITLIAYAISSSFRHKKRREWVEKPRRKYLDLGIGAVCVISLIYLTAWLVIPSPEPANAHETRLAEKMPDEDARLRIASGTVEGSTNEIAIAVKRGGAKKIFKSDSINELRTAIRENVTVVRSATNRTSPPVAPER